MKMDPGLGVSQECAEKARFTRDMWNSLCKDLMQQPGIYSAWPQVVVTVAGRDSGDGGVSEVLSVSS